MEALYQIRLKVPHVSLLPALRPIIMDDQDEERMRCLAIVTITSIDDDTVVPLLLDTMLSKNRRMRFTAAEQLSKMARNALAPLPVVHRFPPGDANTISTLPVGSHELDEKVARARLWWKRVSPHYTFDRSHLMYSE